MSATAGFTRVTGGLVLLLASGLVAAQGTFNVEEATIASTQKAIQDGTITCKGVVQAYIDRIKAYNGTCAATSPDASSNTRPPVTLVKPAVALMFRLT